jgi:hypothetical protein
MATVENANLTLTESEGRVTIRVRYDARFTPFERALHELGWRAHSHITAHGIDGATVGPSIGAVDFPQRNFALTPGDVDEVIPRDEEEVVDRDVLQEDINGDEDELKCKIRIHSVGIPPDFTADVFTDQEVMLG